jgi:hypothetical protein
MKLLWNLVENIALWNFGFSDQKLRVPVVTSGPWIDYIEYFSWIIGICKIYLQFSLCHKQNPEIVLKTKEIKFSSKFAQEMKFFENQGKFELKLSIGVEKNSIIGVKILIMDLKS